MAGRQAKVVLTARPPLCLNSPLFTSKGEILKNKQTIKKKWGQSPIKRCQFREPQAPLRTITST